MKKLVSIILIFVIVYSTSKIIYIKVEEFRDTQNNKEIKTQYYYKDITDKEENEEKSVSVEEVKEKTIETVINEKLLKLRGINEDIVGWIKIPNTNIDYPVVQSDNNEYYLDKDIYGKASTAGSIFMDYRNDLKTDDYNRILYGHNMKNGTIFKDLMKYKYEEFFENNRIITFDTIYGEEQYEIFSVYVTDTSFYYIDTEFKSNDEFNEFLKKIKSKSMFESDIELEESKEILTLSTCSYEFNNARFVVHAKKIKS